MLKNYLVSAYKSFIKQRIISSINLIGLAISLCVVIQVFLFVSAEYSYDKHWKDADRIARLFNEVNTDSGTIRQNISSYLLMPFLRQFYADEIELGARVHGEGGSISTETDVFLGRQILYVDKEYTDIFNFEVVSGDLESIRINPRDIALSEAWAREFFGRDNPLGKIITLKGQGGGAVDYQVAAVFREPRGKSLLEVNAMALLEPSALPQSRGQLESWDASSVLNFFKLAEGITVEQLNQRYGEFVDQYFSNSEALENGSQPNARNHYQFQLLPDAHFDPAVGEEAGDETQISIFGILAIVVLLIGSTNYVIIATARAEGRKVEVGIRKVLGASKGQLIRQYIGESLLLTFVALIIALGLVELTLPAFSTLVLQELSFDLITPKNLIFLVSLTAAVGILGGLYPSFVLSGFNLDSVIKGGKAATFIGAVSVRNILLCFQFSMAVFFLITALAISLQASFLGKRDVGFNLQNLYAVSVGQSPNAVEAGTALVNEIRKVPGVTSVTTASRFSDPQPYAGAGFGSISLIAPNSVPIPAFNMIVGFDFLKTMEIPLLAGRDFDPLLDRSYSPFDNPESEVSASAGYTAIVNEKIVDLLGFPSAEAAIGQLIRVDSSLSLEIVGVVKNNNFYSLQGETGAEYFLIGRDKRLSRFLFVRFEESYAKSIREDIASTFEAVVGEPLLYAMFGEQAPGFGLTRDRNLGRLLATLAVLAFLISCFGLVGLSALTLERREKEIGIRKVMGASDKSILRLFIWQFIKPVLLANIFAWVCAFMAISAWLSGFARRIDSAVLYPIFPAAGMLSLAIVCLTIWLVITKVAGSHPVKSLRYE